MVYLGDLRTRLQTSFGTSLKWNIFLMQNNAGNILGSHGGMTVEYIINQSLFGGEL